MKLPVEIDKLLKDEAATAEKKLKLFIQDLLDVGYEMIQANRTDHQFIHSDYFSSLSAPKDHQYWLDDTYQKKLDALSHLASGQGKLNKIFNECLALALKQKNLKPAKA